MFGLTGKEKELFLHDAKLNAIVVGGKCPTNCIFCSCVASKKVGRQNWTNFISEEDLREAIKLINPKKAIFFGEGPHFLSCEPFAHPNYTKYLKILRNEFPSPSSIIVTTTIGKYIKEENFSDIIENDIKLIVSINTFDKEWRKRLMKSEDNLERLINFLDKCINQIIKVSFLYFGELDILKKDVEFLLSINKKYKQRIFSLRLLDYSKHQMHNKELHDKSYKTWKEALELFRDMDGYELSNSWFRNFSDLGDSNYEIEFKKDFIKNVLIRLSRFDINAMTNNVGILVPESSYCFLKQNTNIKNLILVKNYFFGGSYVSCKLLSYSDIKRAIDENPFEKYFLPREIFNVNDDKDIADISRDEYIKNNPHLMIG